MMSHHFQGTADPNGSPVQDPDNIKVAHLADHALSVPQAWIGPLSLLKLASASECSLLGLKSLKALFEGTTSNVHKCSPCSWC
jgi:hypothetical protein